MNNNDLETYAGREEDFWPPTPAWRFWLALAAGCLAIYGFGIVIGAVMESLL